MGCSHTNQLISPNENKRKYENISKNEKRKNQEIINNNNNQFYIIINKDKQNHNQVEKAVTLTNDKNENNQNLHSKNNDTKLNIRNINNRKTSSKEILIKSSSNNINQVIPIPICHTNILKEDEEEEIEEVGDLIKIPKKLKQHNNILCEGSGYFNKNMNLQFKSFGLRSSKENMNESELKSKNKESLSNVLYINDEDEISIINKINESCITKKEDNDYDISLFKNEFDLNTNNLNNNNISLNETFIFNNLNQDYNSLGVNTITVSASKFEAMHPIWVYKDKQITFEVNGLWTNDTKKKYFDYKGIDEYENQRKDEDIFNDGELICRVLGSEFFSIHKNISYSPYISGPLYFKMNVKDPLSSFEPKGKLIVSISNSKKIQFEKIDQILGWNIKILDTTKRIKNLVISNSDRNLVIFINKIRSNSDLFINQYLYGMSNFGTGFKKLYNILGKIDSKAKNLSSLLVNKDLYYYMKTLMSLDSNVNEKLVKDYLKMFSYIKYFSSHIKDNSNLGVLIKLLTFDDVRECIFSEKASIFSISISSLNNSIISSPLIINNKNKNGYFIQIVFCGNYNKS